MGTRSRNAWPRSEGLLFPGLTIVVLAAIGLSRSEGTAETAKNAEQDLMSQRSLRTLRFLLLVAIAVVIPLLLGFSIRLPGIRITSLPRALVVAAIAGAIVLAVSRDAREAARRFC